MTEQGSERITSTVHVYLVQAATGLFYQAPGRWTADRDKATAFLHVLDAVMEAVKLETRGLDILMTFGDPR